jgi:hypothetical protein
MMRILKNIWNNKSKKTSGNFIICNGISWFRKYKNFRILSLFHLWKAPVFTENRIFSIVQNRIHNNIPV